MASSLIVVQPKINPNISIVGGYKQVDFSNVPYSVWINLTEGLDGTRGTSSWLGSASWQLLPDNLSGYSFAIGSAFDDYIQASSAGNSWLQGGAGNDTLVFSGRYDYLSGGTGSNTADFSLLKQPVWINLTDTSDNTQAWTRGSSLDFGTWTPIANLQSIQDIIGTAYDDFLHGDQSNNIIDGVAGNNKIDGDGGNDTLIGGSGQNSFIFDPGHGNDTIVDFNPSQDVIEFTGGADGFTTFADVLANTTQVVLQDGSTGLQIQGSDGTILLEWANSPTLVSGAVQAIGVNNNLQLSDLQPQNVLIDAGTIVGDPVFTMVGHYAQVDFSNEPYGVWADLTTGQDWTRGTDSWTGTNPLYQLPDNLSGYSFAIGSAFDDYLRASSSGNSWLQGGAGNDTLVFSGRYDYLWGGTGSNTADFSLLQQPVWVNLTNTADNTQAWTRGSSLDSGSWTAIANLQSIQDIIGTAYNDFLHGDQNNNIIDGVAGNNQIDGGGGNDTLIGGPGQNTFLFDPGHGNDTVIDFNPIQDVIEFTGGADGFTSFADVLVHTTQVVLPDGSTGLEIQGSDGTILLEWANSPTLVNGAVQTTGVNNNLQLSDLQPQNISFGPGTIVGDPVLTEVGHYSQVDFSNEPYAVWADLTTGQDWTRGSGSWVGSQPWYQLSDNLAGYSFAIGSAFDDYLRASSSGNSWLQGGAGNDRLVYSGHYDYLSGGSGTNTADLSYATAPVWVDLESNGSQAWSLNSGSWTPIANLQSIQDIVCSTYGGTYDGDNNNNAFIYKGGFVTIDGRGGTNTLDLSQYGYGVEFHEGYSATATSRTLTTNFGEAALTTRYTSYWSSAALNWAGSPYPLADVQNVQNVIGTNYDDCLATGTDGEMNPSAPAQNNIIDGRGGNNRLSAFSGTNTLIGGQGGNDTFVFKPGNFNDTVVDFDPSRDTLEFDYYAGSFTTLAQVLANTTVVAGPKGSTGLDITVPGDGMIHVIWADNAQLQSDGTVWTNGIYHNLTQNNLNAANVKFDPIA